MPTQKLLEPELKPHVVANSVKKEIAQYLG
ncbi:hypothetical protein Riv7116_1353 [Rivularia sp. PCC 7116]|nr:hypothetical protein Riv7116_1353 [Rivularia sp. PCC 7116]